MEIFEFPEMPSLDDLGQEMAKQLRAPLKAVVRERVYRGEICQQLFGVDGPVTDRSAEWTRGSSRIKLQYSSCGGRPILLMIFYGRDKAFFRAAASAAKALNGKSPRHTTSTNRLGKRTGRARRS